MNYGEFCANRETFGISINNGLLTEIGTRNCTLNSISKYDLFSSSVRVLIGLLWLVLIIVGAISNILVLFVISYTKKMRTIANWLLFNLAIADSLMTVIALPILGVFQTFYYPVWVFPDWNCKVLNCFTHIGALASGGSLAAISVHRFIVIRLSRKIHLTSTHLYITIALIWILAIGGSVSSMSSSGIITMIRPVSGQLHKTKLCIQVNPTESKEEFQLAFRLSMYITFSLFLFILYSNIGCFLHRSESPGDHNSAGKNKSEERKRQAVKMLATATVTMIISYFPYMVLVAATLFAKPGYFSPVFGIEIFGNLCLAFNHVCNPFIYCAFSSQFREGFKFVFKRIIGQKGESILSHITSRQAERKSSNAKYHTKLEKLGVEQFELEEVPVRRPKSGSQVTLQSILPNDSRCDSTLQ